MPRHQRHPVREPGASSSARRPSTLRSIPASNTPASTAAQREVQSTPAIISRLAPKIKRAIDPLTESMSAIAQQNQERGDARMRKAFHRHQRDLTPHTRKFIKNSVTTPQVIRAYARGTPKLAEIVDSGIDLLTRRRGVSGAQASAASGSRQQSIMPEPTDNNANFADRDSEAGEDQATSYASFHSDNESEDARPAVTATSENEETARRKHNRRVENRQAATRYRQKNIKAKQKIETAYELFRSLKKVHRQYDLSEDVERLQRGWDRVGALCKAAEDQLEIEL